MLKLHRGCEELVAQLKKTVTIIQVTHNIAQAARVLALGFLNPFFSEKEGL